MIVCSKYFEALSQVNILNYKHDYYDVYGQGRLWHIKAYPHPTHLASIEVFQALKSHKDSRKIYLDLQLYLTIKTFCSIALSTFWY